MKRLAVTVAGLTSLAVIVSFWGNTQVTDIGFWGLAMSALHGLVGEA